MTAAPGKATRLSWTVGILTGLGISGTSAVAVVLPTAAADLSMDPTTTAWVLIGFALPLAVFTPVFGRLADRFGIRRPLVVGVVVMSVSALAAASAPTAAIEIAARLVQGAGAASVAVLGVALVSQGVTPEERPKALARVAGSSAALAALAPLVGGAVAALAGWRPVVALPALGLLLLAPLVRAAPTVGRGGSFDLVGAFAVAAMATGVILLAQAPAGGTVLAMTGGALVVAGLPLLALQLRRRPDGFLPRRLLANHAVITAASAAAGVQAAWFALLLLVPAALAQEGWNALSIGVALVPGAVVALIAARTSSVVLTRLGSRPTLLLSAAIAIGALVLGAVGLALTAPPLLIAAVAAIALGYAQGQPAMLSRVDTSTDEEVRGTAVGLATLIFITGAAFGSAVVGGSQPFLPGWAVLGVTTALPLLGAVVLALDRPPHHVPGRRAASSPHTRSSPTGC